MSCLSSERRAELQARLEKKQALLDKLYEAFDNFDGVADYKFDSAAGGMQQTRYRKIEDIQDAIERVESQIDTLRAKLNGTGLVNLNLRRKGYTWGL